MRKRWGAVGRHLNGEGMSTEAAVSDANLQDCGFLIRQLTTLLTLLQNESESKQCEVKAKEHIKVHIAILSSTLCLIMKMKDTHRPNSLTKIKFALNTIILTVIQVAILFAQLSSGIIFSLFSSSVQAKFFSMSRNTGKRRNAKTTVCPKIHSAEKIIFIFLTATYDQWRGRSVR